jgi:NAD(P)-dependent dehydrogenase (short-subunit alcohol dehydrogenase family)
MGKLSKTSPPHSAKRAVVIGATGSLGGHVTQQLLSAGWSVTGVSRRSVGAISIPRFEHIPIDLNSRPASGRLFAVFKRVAPHLILHAAVSYGDARNPSTKIDELERMFRINTFSFYLGFLRYCASPNITPFCSCIVINSDSIYHATGQTGAYASSKAALRVLTTALADRCRSTNASVSTLLLGPLADVAKRIQLRNLAARRGVSEASLVREYLHRSNPFLVINELIALDTCYESVRYLVQLGKDANGMLCKLDGGSSGSLV